MNPILFRTNSFTLHSLWFFIAIAIFTGILLSMRFSLQNRLKLQFFSDQSLKITIASIIGARILFIIMNYQFYFQEISLQSLLNLFFIWDKGLSFYGGFIGFFLYMYYACKKNDQDFWKWADAIIPALAIAVAIGHIGAFFDGINYGKETELPWGVNFESPRIKYTVPIHPTQIYAFIYSLAIGIGLNALSHAKKFQEQHFNGIITLSGVFLYSLFRFLEGFLRDDDTIMIFQNVRLSQIVALNICVVSGLFLFLRYNNQRKQVNQQTENNGSN